MRESLEEIPFFSLKQLLPPVNTGICVVMQDFQASLVFLVNPVVEWLENYVKPHGWFKLKINRQLIAILNYNLVLSCYCSVREYVHVTADGICILCTISFVLCVHTVPHDGLIYDVKGAHVYGRNNVKSLQEVIQYVFIWFDNIF